MFRFSSRFHILSSTYDSRPRLKAAKAKFQVDSNNTTIIDITFRPVDSIVYEDIELAPIPGEVPKRRRLVKQDAKEDIYYQPENGQQVGIDAFFLHERCLYLIQITGGATHDYDGPCWTKMNGGGQGDRSRIAPNDSRSGSEGVSG